VSVIVQPKGYQRWLDPENGNVADILAPPSSEGMIAYPVSRRVNSPKNAANGEERRYASVAKSSRSTALSTHSRQPIAPCNQRDSGPSKDSQRLAACSERYRA
jgi:hypothetical protein